MIFSRRTNKGIALLEVMIAMGIVATAATALLLRMQSIANSTSFVEDRTVAHWIADNLMQERFADDALQNNILRDRGDQDEIEYDGREWFWESTLEEKDLGLGIQTYELKITVGLDKDKPLATLSRYLSE